MKKEHHISTYFFQSINDLLDKTPKDELKEMINKEWLTKVLFSEFLLLRISTIDSLQDEIGIIFSKFGVSHSSFFIKNHSIEELILSIKMYLISWSTLSELILYFISSTLNLGLSEKDINFGLLQRNKHFLSTNFPDIFKKHSKRIDFSNTTQSRNKAIHEGLLIDDVVTELQKNFNQLHSKRYSLLNYGNQITDEEYNNGLKSLNKELNELVEQKTEEYKKHYSDTLKLLKEIMEESAQIMFKKKIKNL